MEKGTVQRELHPDEIWRSYYGYDGTLSHKGFQEKYIHTSKANM